MAGLDCRCSEGEISFDLGDVGVVGFFAGEYGKLWSGRLSSGFEGFVTVIWRDGLFGVVFGASAEEIEVLGSMVCLVASLGLLIDCFRSTSPSGNITGGVF